MLIYIYIYIYIYIDRSIDRERERERESREQRAESRELPYPWSGDDQGQEMFLATSADKQTLNYDTEWSNHYPSQLP